MSDSERQMLAPPPHAPASQRRAYLLQGAAALVVLVVAIFLARSLLQTAPTAGSRPIPERQARLVDVVTLEATEYQPRVTGWGTLRPSRELTLRAQVSGAVESLSTQLEPGMTVKAGDRLMQLDAASYKAALAQARSAMAEAEANLALEQGQQAIALREFQLLTEGTGNVDLRPGLALREPQLAIAQAAVDSARAQLVEARLNLDRTILKAPFEAMVGSRSVTLGSQVGSGTDIARLIGIDTWWVEVLLPADRLSWLDASTDASGPVPVTLRQPGVWSLGQSRQGTLLRVLQELEAEGNLARLLVAVEDPLGRNTEPGAPGVPRLLLGSFLRADILGPPLRDVFVLKPRWLRENSSVWLMAEDETLRMTPVTVLYRDEDAVIVRASDGGIEVGDKLVTSRFSAPAEGMPLRTEARTDQAGSQTTPVGSGTGQHQPLENGTPSGGAKQRG